MLTDRHTGTTSNALRCPGLSYWLCPVSSYHVIVRLPAANPTPNPAPEIKIFRSSHIGKKLIGNQKRFSNEPWECGRKRKVWMRAQLVPVLKLIQALKEYFLCHVYCAHFGTPWHQIVTASCTVAARKSNYFSISIRPSIFFASCNAHFIILVMIEQAREYTHVRTHDRNKHLNKSNSVRTHYYFGHDRAGSRVYTHTYVR